MHQYVLSPNAQASLRHIKSYSIEHLGEEQSISYLKFLEKRMQWIAENPNAGRKREELEKGYFSFLAGSRIIFYRKAKNYIDIIDVLHQSLDPYQHLKT